MSVTRTRISFSPGQLLALDAATIKPSEFAALVRQASVVARFAETDTPDLAVVRRGDRLTVELEFVNIEPGDHLVRFGDVMARLADIEAV